MYQKSDLYCTTNNMKPQAFSIESIKGKDIDYIIEMSMKLFSESAKHDYSGLYFYCMTDFNVSKKAVLDGKIIGCYLLNDESVHYYEMNRLENLDRYKTKRGLLASEPYRRFGQGFDTSNHGLKVWKSCSFNAPPSITP